MSLLLPFVQKGRKDGPLIVFMAGFPDNETSAWGEVVPRELEKNYNLLFMCMPDFQKGNKEFKPWGHPFKEIVERMDNTIQSVKAAKEKVVIIGHDWGAILSLLYENKYPQNVEKVVLLDVGILKPPEVPIVQLLLILLYQFWFAIAYILASTLNHTLGDIHFKLYYLPFLKFLSPCPNDTLTIPMKDFSVSRCYPYYHYWKGKFTGTGVEPRFPSCPLLFLVRLLLYSSYLYLTRCIQYGTEKRCNFHGKSFIYRIDKTQGCKHAKIQGGRCFSFFAKSKR